MLPQQSTSRSLDFKARSIEAAIRHLETCIANEVAATLALNQFQIKYSLATILNDPILRIEEIRLKEIMRKAWYARFAAYRAANPPTIQDV